MEYSILNLFRDNSGWIGLYMEKSGLSSETCSYQNLQLSIKDQVNQWLTRNMHTDDGKNTLPIRWE